MYIIKYMYKTPYDGHLKNIKATILRQAVNSAAKNVPDMEQLSLRLSGAAHS